jgi:hypothetical protein
MSRDAVSETQFAGQPKPERLRGFHVYGMTHASGERSPDYGGTLCTGCYKKATKGWHPVGFPSPIPPVTFDRAEEIRGAGDAYDVDVCEDCGRTIRKGKYI